MRFASEAISVPPRGPRAVRTFGSFIWATGGTPLLRMSDQRLLRGHFDIAVTITDNAVVAASLTSQSSWDKRVQTLYGAASSPIKGVLHLAGAELYVNDANYRGETEALKVSLDNLAYLHSVRGGKVMDWPFRGHIIEPWSQFEFHEATNTAVERGLQSQPPWLFERPYRVDLETDQLTFQVDTAINWASGNILGYVRLHGHLAPKDFPGSQVQDTNCDDMNDVFTAIDPVRYRDVRQVSNPMHVTGGAGVNMTLGF